MTLFRLFLGAMLAVIAIYTLAVAPTRAKLIEKGMIYSLAHDDTAFTVPLFDEYLRRVLPGLAVS